MTENDEAERLCPQCGGAGVLRPADEDGGQTCGVCGGCGVERAVLGSLRYERILAEMLRERFERNPLAKANAIVSHYQAVAESVQRLYLLLLTLKRDDLAEDVRGDAVECVNSLVRMIEQHRRELLGV